MHTTKISTQALCLLTSAPLHGPSWIFSTSWGPLAHWGRGASAIALSNNELIKHYRFPRHELLQLIDELEPALRRRTKRGHAVPPHTQVLMALRVFAGGSFPHIIRDVTSRLFSLFSVYSHTGVSFPSVPCTAAIIFPPSPCVFDVLTVSFRVIVSHNFCM